MSEPSERIGKVGERIGKLGAFVSRARSERSEERA